MNTQRNFPRAILVVGLVTLLLLSIPLIAMQFSTEVDWKIGDFLIMGALLFSLGFSYVLITRSATNFIHRAAAGLAIVSTFLLIWANLAVGLIGSGPNPGNLLYIGVVGVVITGTMLSQFTAKGMSQTMFATALALALHTGIALLANMDQYPGSSVVEIICVNAFFATLFSVSGLLFRYKDLKQHPAGSQS